MLPTTHLRFGDFDFGKIKIRRNLYIVLGDFGGFLDFWQVRNAERPQNQLVRKVRKVRQSPNQKWTATDRRKTKRGATSQRNGGQNQTEVWRCSEIEQKAGNEAIGEECRSRSPSALLRTERAAMPLRRGTLPLRRITAIGHKKYCYHSEELLLPLRKRHDLPFMNLVALFMLS